MGEALEAIPATTLDTITAEILILKRQTAQNIIEIGRRLTQAKEAVGHGNWLPYLRDRVQFSERTAQRFMRVAQEFGNTTALSHLEPTKALLLLEAPEESREALAIESAELTTRETEARVRELNEERRRREEAESRAAELEKRAQAAQRDAVETGRRLEKVAQEKGALEDELRNRPTVQVPVEKPVVKPDDAARSENARLREENAKLRAEQGRLGDLKAAEERLLAQTRTLQEQNEALRAENAQLANLQEEALRVNMALRELQDVATRHRGLFETAKGKEYGDWIDLQGIYDTETLLQAILRDFHRITKDCVRR